MTTSPTSPTSPVDAGSAEQAPPRLAPPVRAVLSLLMALASAAAVWVLARAAVGTASGQRMDQLILSGAQAHEGRLAEYAQIAILSVSAPAVIALLAIAAVLVLLRRRGDLLLPIGLVVLGANVTTQVLKHLVITREALGPGIEITPNSFPSGHTTLAATALVAVVLASGGARVVLAPLGAAWTAAAGIGTLVEGWHRPSDVVGAIVVVAAWTFLALAVDGLLARRRLARRPAAPAPGRGRRRAATSSALQRTRAIDMLIGVLLGGLGLAGLALGALDLGSLGLPLDLQDAAQQSTAFTATALLIAGGTAIWMALVLLLRTPISHRA
ncbi:phosphatase PAP2 family protein [Brachybacterium sp. J144]|uniref:phosphatase PAP2 family protein n=1 Tax=Brachybacterium sp. J144 TaxID=3116487 RepID=UPI002E7777E7|nr:phosphatase PAP2 family protein [Brachybacterium sp. J144]MEE1650883.1 phosphatase PAP2 family protein [Brachybacterium sp. J144]